METRPPVSIMPFERVAIFIDGWNFKYATFDSFGLKVDYIKLLKYLTRNAILLRAYYYTGEWDDAAISHFIRLSEPPDPELKKKELEEGRDADRKFLRFLDRNGYKVIRKPLRVHKDAEGEVKLKADLDLEIAIDMLTLTDRCEKQILVSGDSDFVPLVNAVAERGVRVVVISTQHEDAFRNAHYRASDQLLDAADEFISIESIMSHIGR
ncbi:MAG: NYN domain-containing protein [Candidatus Eremiobacteraeota bacterium]|nr:NYN domain-containing protein [Candidatus Eremiobacteraeota bacterium]